MQKYDDNNMKKVYLVLAILGGVIPYIFFFEFIQTHGLDIPGFMKGLFASGASGGFTADLLLTSFVFWIYMFVESRANKGPAPWLFIVLNLSIGLSCAFPAYLYAREVQRAKSVL